MQINNIEKSMLAEASSKREEDAEVVEKLREDVNKQEDKIVYAN